MRETMKDTKGITLIALVITIIVLLILAIVTIRIITTGGIIEHAKNGVQAYNEAQTNELALLKDAENKIAELGTQKDDLTILKAALVGKNYNGIFRSFWYHYRKGDEFYYQHEEGGYYEAYDYMYEIAEEKEGEDLSYYTKDNEEYKNIIVKTTYEDEEDRTTNTQIVYIEYNGNKYKITATGENQYQIIITDVQLVEN